MWIVEYKNKWSYEWHEAGFKTLKEAQQFMATLDFIVYEWYDPIYRRSDKK